MFVGLSSLGAGFFDTLTSMGGGVLVPLLVLAFGVGLRNAVGASPVTVIAMSSGAAAEYVREGDTNIRIGMVLDVATTLGRPGGGIVPASVLAVVFGFVLLMSADLSIRPHAGPTRPTR